MASSRPLEAEGSCRDCTGATLLAEQEDARHAQRLDVVLILRKHTLRRLDCLLPVAHCHEHAEFLHEGRKEPGVLHDYLVELLERVFVLPAQLHEPRLAHR